MAGITGMGTTFNLPNFVGELFNISPEDTPLLTAIGGLTGGKRATAKRFEWEFYDLRAASDRSRVEGAVAPTAEERVRVNASNVLQIIQEAVEVSYTKLAARNHLTSATLVGGEVNPVTNEMDWQLDQALKQIALDVNWAFINGQFAEPGTNASPRKTRGLLQAIQTNVVTLSGGTDVGGDITGANATDIITSATAHGLVVGDTVQFTTLNGGAGLTAATQYFVVAVPTTTTFQVGATRGGSVIDFTTAITTGSRISTYAKVSNESLGNAMQMAFDSGGLQLGETRVAIVGPLQKRRLTKALITDVNYQETSRNVGGVNLSVIETDFGPLSIMMDRQMPAGTIVLASLEELAPVILEIPDKGFLFVEALAKTGASNASQIYGEIGLEYGNERKHAKIIGAG